MANAKFNSLQNRQATLQQRGLTPGQWLDYRDGHGGWQRVGSRPEITEHGSYALVSAVYSCVKVRAESIGMMPLRVGNNQDDILDSGPLVDLVEKPTKGMTTRAFWRSTESHLSLFGRAHWRLENLPGGQPVSVTPLHPLCMMARLDPSTGELMGWTYTPPGTGRQEVLSVEEVHSIIDPDYENPGDPFCGLSPRKAAAMAIIQYRLSDSANHQSMRNGSSPGGFLSTDKNLTEEQHKLMNEQLGTLLNGHTKRHRIMIAEGGLKFTPIPTNFSDMEFSQLKTMSREDICAAFNVPPACIGYYADSNYGHASAAEESFWMRTILPRAAWLAEEFELAVVSRFEGNRSLGMSMANVKAMTPRDRMGRGFARAFNRPSRRTLYAWFDSSSVPAVQASMAGMADAANKWNMAGVPTADFLDAHDLGYQRHPWQETWWREPFKIDAREDALGQPNPGRKKAMTTPATLKLEDLFLDPARRDVEPLPGQIGHAAMSVKSLDEKKRQIHFLCSAGSVDRDGEIIDPQAFANTIDAFMTNPVFVAAHVYSTPNGEPTVIGHWVDLKISKDGLEGIAQFDDEDPLAQRYWNHYRKGNMRAVSVGFFSRSWEMREVKGADGQMRRVRAHTQVELVEISAVTVPSNRHALARAAAAFAHELPADDDRIYSAVKRALHDVLTAGTEVSFTRSLALEVAQVMRSCQGLGGGDYLDDFPADDDVPNADADAQGDDDESSIKSILREAMPQQDA